MKHPELDVIIVKYVTDYKFLYFVFSKIYYAPIHKCHKVIKLNIELSLLLDRYPNISSLLMLIYQFCGRKLNQNL